MGEPLTHYFCDEDGAMERTADERLGDWVRYEDFLAMLTEHGLAPCECGCGRIAPGGHAGSRDPSR